ncbi:FabA-like domain protein [Paenibacillus sambharensis]|uniref:FabA-like domain protein n=1 Tax=Paenibacillus sambharensis TaxID=1803190 RepID=A0A2W1LPI1_9BACL|nr:FabA-like domain protein [Paenibacillus sambharensis]PZD96832.1 FabA-like domain protein [Paenibacillus sambharensis]
MDVRQILQLLPHKPPFRLVDEVSLYIPGNKLEARFNPADYRDAFGGLDYVPIAILLEGLAQTGVLLTQLETAPLEEHEFPMLGTVRADIHRPVMWPETLVFMVKPYRLLTKSAVLHGTIQGSGGSPIAEAQLSVAVAKAELEGE